MGPLVVAMPRSKYQGAFSDNVEVSTSKLVGSENEDYEEIARQMASRLTKKLGIAIFASCNFEGGPQVAVEGIDQGMVIHRAAALAEREIARILKEKL